MAKPERTLNPEHITDALRRYNMVGFNHANGFVVDEIGEGFCKAHLNLSEANLNIVGGVHGGAIATLADIVTFLSIYCALDEDQGFTTLDLNVSYIRPASSGTLHGEGQVIRQGRTVCFTEALIYDDAGKLVAQATEKVYVAGPDKLLPMTEALQRRDPNTPLPPKFL